MTQTPVTCSPHDRLDAACLAMWENDCGIVPVVDDNGRLLGVLTDRDAAMAAWSRGVSMGAIPVDSVMCREVIACDVEDTLEDIHTAMRKARVRRIPVVDAERHLLGVVSINDLVRHATTGRSKSTGYQALAETLTRIGVPQRKEARVRAIA
jgi:CBS domain-containing protein